MAKYKSVTNMVNHLSGWRFKIRWFIHQLFCNEYYGEALFPCDNCGMVIRGQRLIRNKKIVNDGFKYYCGGCLFKSKK